MAVVKMNRFTLMTFHTYREGLLKELQRFENIQFNSLQNSEEELEYLNKVSFGDKVSELESESAKIKFALEKIKPYAQKPSGMQAFTSPPPSLSYEEFDAYTDHYDYKSVYESIKDADGKLRACKSEKDRLKGENQNLNNWVKLDVSLKEVEDLKSIRYLIGTISKASADSFREAMENAYPQVYIEYFGAAQDEVTGLLLAPADDYESVSSLAKNSGFTRVPINLPQKPSDIIAENNARIAQIELAETSLAESFQQYGSEYNSLMIANDYFQAALIRAQACENFLKSDTVLVIEGWFPQELSLRLTEILNGVCGKDYYIEETAVEKDSTDVPIKLKNNKFVAAFENITSMYSLPKYSELDPTPVLTPFYWAFFGLMVGDTGYGLILWLATFIVLKFFSLKAGTRKFMQFFHYLSYAVIIAGFLYGSIFGFTFFAPIKTETGSKAILDTNVDIALMIVLSIIVGIGQIVFGLLVKGYALLKDGKVFAAIFDSLCWITTLFGAIGWILGGFGIASAELGNISKWTFIISVIGLALTQGRESPSLGGKIGNGLYSVYGLTSYVGDIVSYTRLVALALSGAYIAFAFNKMAELLPEGILRIVAGGLIIVVGQTINFGLSLLSAYVHDCRLQYVEYFSKFYDGGGKPFNPFQLMNKHVHIKNSKE